MLYDSDQVDEDNCCVETGNGNGCASSELTCPRFRQYIRSTEGSDNSHGVNVRGVYSEERFTTDVKGDSLKYTGKVTDSTDALHVPPSSPADSTIFNVVRKHGSTLRGHQTSCKSTSSCQHPRRKEDNSSHHLTHHRHRRRSSPYLETPEYHRPLCHQQHSAQLSHNTQHRVNTEHHSSPLLLIPGSGLDERSHDLERQIVTDTEFPLSDNDGNKEDADEQLAASFASLKPDTDSGYVNETKCLDSHPTYLKRQPNSSLDNTLTDNQNDADHTGRQSSARLSNARHCVNISADTEMELSCSNARVLIKDEEECDSECSHRRQSSRSRDDASYFRCASDTMHSGNEQQMAIQLDDIRCVAATSGCNCRAVSSLLRALANLIDHPGGALDPQASEHSAAGYNYQPQTKDIESDRMSYHCGCNYHRSNDVKVASAHHDSTDVDDFSDSAQRWQPTPTMRDVDADDDTYTAWRKSTMHNKQSTTKKDEAFANEHAGQRPTHKCNSLANNNTNSSAMKATAAHHNSAVNGHSLIQQRHKNQTSDKLLAFHSSHAFDSRDLATDIATTIPAGCPAFDLKHRKVSFRVKGKATSESRHLPGRCLCPGSAEHQSRFMPLTASDDEVCQKSGRRSLFRIDKRSFSVPVSVDCSRHMNHSSMNHSSLVKPDSWTLDYGALSHHQIDDDASCRFDMERCAKNHASSDHPARTQAFSAKQEAAFSHR